MFSVTVSCRTFSTCSGLGNAEQRDLTPHISLTRYCLGEWRGEMLIGCYRATCRTLASDWGLWKEPGDDLQTVMHNADILLTSCSLYLVESQAFRLWDQWTHVREMQQDEASAYVAGPTAASVSKCKIPSRLEGSSCALQGLCSDVLHTCPLITQIEPLSPGLQFFLVFSYLCLWLRLWFVF